MRRMQSAITAAAQQLVHSGRSTATKIMDATRSGLKKIAAATQRWPSLPRAPPVWAMTIRVIRRSVSQLQGGRA